MNQIGFSPTGQASSALAAFTFGSTWGALLDSDWQVLGMSGQRGFGNSQVILMCGWSEEPQPRQGVLYLLLSWRFSLARNWTCPRKEKTQKEWLVETNNVDSYTLRRKQTFKRKKKKKDQRLRKYKKEDLSLCLFWWEKLKSIFNFLLLSVLFTFLLWLKSM